MFSNKVEQYRGFIKLMAVVVIFILGMKTWWLAEDLYWLNGLRTANESEFKHERMGDIIKISAASNRIGIISIYFDLQEMPSDIYQEDFSPKSLYLYNCFFKTLFGGIPIILMLALTVIFLRNIYKGSTPFTLKNANLLKIISCIAIAYGVFEQSLAKGFIYKQVFGTFRVELWTVYMEWLAIMFGVVLLIISIAFSYGIYLQEEYNDTV